MPALAIVKFDSGFSEVQRGSLIDCPAEFFSLAQMAFYQGCQPGWSTCPLGYSTYAAFDAMGRKFVVPGNYPPEGPAPKRKFPGWALRFSKKQIEAFLEPHLSISEQVRLQRDDEFKNLTHDLRAISTEIYHTALNTKSLADDIAQDSLISAITSIMNAQQMMSLRLDIIDYESGYSANRPKEYINVYKKVDKVLRCFANRMAHNRLTYRIEGRQFATTYGPPIFEIVPFVVVENAVKYAPIGSDLVVRFEETNTDIVIRFESLGPRISASERSKIFDQHFRGHAAKNSQRGGSGIGLYAAKTLLETQFSGKIYVFQSDDLVWVDGLELYKTRFTIVVPIVEGVISNRGRSKTRPAFGLTRMH